MVAGGNLVHEGSAAAGATCASSLHSHWQHRHEHCERACRGKEYHAGSERHEDAPWEFSEMQLPLHSMHSQFTF